MKVYIYKQIMVTYLFSKLLRNVFMCQALNVCWGYHMSIYHSILKGLKSSGKTVMAESLWRLVKRYYNSLIKRQPVTDLRQWQWVEVQSTSVHWWYSLTSTDGMWCLIECIFGEGRMQRKESRLNLRFLVWARLQIVQVVKVMY